MAFSFEDMTAAVEAYPAASVDLEIVDVVFPGSVINVNERPSFRVKVTNRGPLEMTGVTLRIKGLNGATVKQNGAAAPFVSEFVTTTSQLATVGGHGGSQTTNGSPFSFTAPWLAAAQSSSRPGHPRGSRLHAEPHPERSQRPASQRAAQGLFLRARLRAL